MLGPRSKHPDDDDDDDDEEDQEIEIEVRLDNTGVLPDARGSAEWEQDDDQTEFIVLGALQDRIESWQNAGRQRGIEYRFPLLSKRVIEFAMRLPAYSRS